MIESALSLSPLVVELVQTQDYCNRWRLASIVPLPGSGKWTKSTSLFKSASLEHLRLADEVIGVARHLPELTVHM